jgi:alpha-glucosidase
VQEQQHDEDAMLLLYKRLIDFRQKEPALTIGNYRPAFSDNKMIAYIREHDNQRLLIVLNLSHSTSYFNPEHLPVKGTIELATHAELEGTQVSGTLCLGGDEGVVIRLSQ